MSSKEDGKTQDLLNYTKGQLDEASQAPPKPKDLPVSVMAYIGDAVFELKIRLALTRRFQGKSGDLHRRCVRMVKAAAQAEAARTLLYDLSEEEAAIFRRGRNNTSYSLPKHASALDYRLATGLEALVGWLYLQNSTQRLNELIERIMDYFAYGENKL